MTSYTNKAVLQNPDSMGYLENIYEKIKDLKNDFKHVEENMRSAVESLQHDDTNGGYYPGKFTEKIKRKSLTRHRIPDHCQSFVQIPVDRELGTRGKVLSSWTPWPSWTIRWEKIRKKGKEKSDIQILSCESSIVEYQLL